jgi:hypothetical protein
MSRYPRITRVHDHEREERRYMVDEGGPELTGPSFLTRAECAVYLEEVRARMPPKAPKAPKPVRRYCDVCGVCLRLEWVPATCRKCGGVGPVWKRPVKATEAA